MLRDFVYTHKHTNLQLYNKDHLRLALEHIFEGHDVLVLEFLQDLHLFLHTCPLQAQAAPHATLQLQELSRPQDAGSPLTHLTHLPEMTTGVAGTYCQSVQLKPVLHVHTKQWPDQGKTLNQELLFYQ